MIRPLLFTAFITLSITSSHAAKESGGGDMLEPKAYYALSTLNQWVLRGGYKNLDYSNARVTELIDGKVVTTSLTPEIYLQRMQPLFGYGAVHVSIVDEPVEYDGEPKTCTPIPAVEDVQACRQAGEKYCFSRPTIRCHRQRMSALREDGMIKLMHHEAAVLAGIEPNDGRSSNYVLSQQLRMYMTTKTITTLAVRPLVENYSLEEFRAVLLKELKTKLAKEGAYISSEVEELMYIEDLTDHESLFKYDGHVLDEIVFEGDARPGYVIDHEEMLELRRKRKDYVLNAISKKLLKRDVITSEMLLKRIKVKGRKFDIDKHCRGEDREDYENTFFCRVRLNGYYMSLGFNRDHNLLRVTAYHVDEGNNHRCFKVKNEDSFRDSFLCTVWGDDD